jgi:hypothetical protein
MEDALEPTLTLLLLRAWFSRSASAVMCTKRVV